MRVGLEFQFDQISSLFAKFKRRSPSDTLALNRNAQLRDF
jgi:hypothetical protein